MGERAGRGDAGIHVHVVAVIDGADRFALEERQGVRQVLSVTPRGEAGEFVERTLDDGPLRPHRALRLDRGDCGEPDAREQHHERPPEAADAQRLDEGRQVPARHVSREGRADAARYVTLIQGMTSTTQNVCRICEMKTCRPAFHDILGFGALLLLGAATAGAQQAPPIARYVPPAPDAAHVFVLDSAHILSPATVAALQDSARALQTETGADVAWVTLPTLGGRPIEEAALYIGRTWRIGTPGQPGDPLRNRGLVILFVPDKTKTAGSNFRIEVGNGLEGTITDSRSRSISAAMREDLKAKRYDAAYLAGWPVAARLVREDFNARAVANIAPAPPTSQAVALTPTTHSAAAIGGLVVVAFILAMIGLALASSRRRGRAWGASSAGFIPIPVDTTTTNDDDEARRRPSWQSFDSSSSSGSSGDSGSSDSGGGDMGGGGGFSGGGSSDTI